jgi:hypothetical protein
MNMKTRILRVGAVGLLVMAACCKVVAIPTGYAILSGGNISYSSDNIFGDVRANGNMSVSSTVIHGSATATGTIMVSGTGASVTGSISEGAAAITLPSLNSVLTAFSSYHTISGGALTVGGSWDLGKGVYYASGNISLANGVFNGYTFIAGGNFDMGDSTDLTGNTLGFAIYAGHDATINGIVNGEVVGVNNVVVDTVATVNASTVPHATTVPDGGSTAALLGLALLGMGGLCRKMRHA